MNFLTKKPGMDLDAVLAFDTDGAQQRPLPPPNATRAARFCAAAASRLAAPWSPPGSYRA